MPLTARLDRVELLYATCISDEAWAAIHDVRPRPNLHCRDCATRMHAKVSPTGLRFFAHDRKAVNCASLGETPEHRQIKQMLAEMIRELGCTAELEAVPAADDSGGWRADVLATSPRGVRVALEVQLAAMTIEEGRRRTSRYAADGIACVWLTTRHAPWLTGIPSCHILLGDDEVVVDRGLARLQQDRWSTAGIVPLRKVMLGLLKGAIVAVDGGYFYDNVGGRFCSISSSSLLVSTFDAAQFQRAQHEARLRSEAAERERAAHEANLYALIDRQDRVLQFALRFAMAEGVESSQIRLGVPPKPWDGSFPAPWKDAVGNQKTAQAAVIWVAYPEETTLWAAMCPVAAQANDRLGLSWRQRRVKVFVETPKEAVRVSRALGWPATTLLVSSR